MIKRLVLTGATLAVLAAPSAVDAQEFCFSALQATCVTFNGIAWSAGDPAAVGSFSLNTYSGGLVPTEVAVYWHDGTAEWGACADTSGGFGTYAFTATCWPSVGALALEQIEIGRFIGFEATVGGSFFECGRDPTAGGGVISSTERSSVQFASMFAFFQIPDCIERAVSVPAPAAALLSVTGLIGLFGAAFRRREDEFEDVA